MLSQPIFDTKICINAITSKPYQPTKQPNSKRKRYRKEKKSLKKH
jgi:hypothetical protein